LRGRDRFGFRLVHFSVQGNHIHLVVEAQDERSLASGLQGLGVRIAKALNRVMGRKGTVFAVKRSACDPRSGRSTRAYAAVRPGRSASIASTK